MADDAGFTARRELLDHIRELLKAVRLMKGELATHVPAGTFQVLATIRHLDAGASPGCHLKDLAARCALDPSTVSRSVASLVKAGLVARTADPDDGRASVLTLTADGRQTLDEVFGRLDDHLADVLEEWSFDDVAAFTALMHRFTTDLMSRHHHPLEAAR